MRSGDEGLIIGTGYVEEASIKDSSKLCHETPSEECISLPLWSDEGICTALTQNSIVRLSHLKKK